MPSTQREIRPAVIEFSQDEMARIVAIATSRTPDGNSEYKAVIGTAAEIAFGLAAYPERYHDAVWRNAAASYNSSWHYDFGHFTVRVQGATRPQGIAERPDRAEADVYVLAHVRHSGREVALVGWTERSGLRRVPSRRNANEDVLHAGIETLNWMPDLWSLIDNRGVEDEYETDEP